MSARVYVLLEVAGVFAVFWLFGAWQVPDLNEAYYVGKAIHFWNPDWISNDSFLESKDSHWAFYLAFGWVSLFCPPAATAWIGRILAWSLLALSWQRLSFALLPVRQTAILTAVIFAYYVQTFHMAGEWIIGGVEGKSFAYPFVLFALEAMLRRRWNRVCLFLGTASAFHILAGGWATLIMGVIFLITKYTKKYEHTQKNKKEFRVSSFLFVNFVLTHSLRFIGGLLFLCGLVPALLLDYGTPTNTAYEAHQIYVFNRLSHHLVPYLFKTPLLVRFLLLTAIWILLCCFNKNANPRQRTFDAFVWGTLGIAAIGMILAYSFSGNRQLSAEVLRFYWFRLSDIAVPMGITFGAFSYFSASHKRKRIYVPFGLLLVCPILLGQNYPDLGALKTYCRSEPVGPLGKRAAAEWLDMCRWIKENTAKTDKFWVPRDGSTFKWHANRSDIGVWKDIPQDAASIVQWYRAMNELFRYKGGGVEMTDRLITALLLSKTEAEIEVLRQRYGFSYIVCGLAEEMPQHGTLKRVYANEVYVLYQVQPLNGKTNNER
jgi:hypothetical protein